MGWQGRSDSTQGGADGVLGAGERQQAAGVRGSRVALLLLGSWSSTLPSQHRAVSSPRSPPCYLPKSLLGKSGLHHSPASHTLCSLPLPSAGPGLVCARGRLSPNLNPSVRVRVPQFGLGRGRGRPGGPGGPGAGPGAEAAGRAGPAHCPEPPHAGRDERTGRGRGAEVCRGSGEYPGGRSPGWALS